MSIDNASDSRKSKIKDREPVLLIHWMQINDQNDDIVMLIMIEERFWQEHSILKMLCQE